MDFTFNDDQLTFREAMSRFLMTEAAPEMLREIWETDVGRSPELRGKLAEQGLTALSAYHTVGRLAKGAKIGAEASTNKIVWSELDLKMHETAMRILGPRGELLSDAPDAGADAAGWLDGFLFAQAGPIYAGTNEIQRNIIAERMLGLPKS